MSFNDSEKLQLIGLIIENDFEAVKNMVDTPSDEDIDAMYEEEKAKGGENRA